MFFWEMLTVKPMLSSVDVPRTPSVSRSPLGVAAVTAALIRATTPKTLIDAQRIPAAPRLPSISDSAVEAPTKVVRAAISMMPPANVGR